ncbi:DUF1638 domain-containing protein [Thalassospiraceae bacterium LMO-JJ14]|nr:DUF1638 domain-containing protein [Thalassospiraceae bacterium LMO-JJ14]
MRPLLIIACGALAREIGWVVDANALQGIDLTCLPAELHNRPDRIPDEMRRKIDANQGKYERIVALYADCGTGGLLDDLLAEKGVERIGGAHCYAFYAGEQTFEKMHEDEIGTFYLTDYLVRFFDRLIIKGLGLDRQPELRDAYFGNYKRLTYLAQTEDPALQEQAKKAADTLGLDYVYHFTGYGGLGDFIVEQSGKGAADGAADHRILA